MVCTHRAGGSGMWVGPPRLWPPPNAAFVFLGYSARAAGNWHCLRNKSPGQGKAPRQTCMEYEPPHALSWDRTANQWAGPFQCMAPSGHWTNAPVPELRGGFHCGGYGDPRWVSYLNGKSTPSWCRRCPRGALRADLVTTH